MQTHPQPERTEFVIRGANVVTMDPQLGEIAGGDVHVRDGAIVAVGRKLQAPDAQEIDGSYTICMPGFVDTHWHMWTSLFRGYAGSTPERGYLQLRNRYGHLVTPEEVYHCVRVSLAEALNAGITTVHNWTHNMNTPQHADETVHAHHSIPLRARYSYGAPHWLAADETMDLNEVARVQKDHFSGNRDSLLGMGVAMRGPEFDGSTPRVYRREWEVARALGLPITVHVAEYVDCDRWAAIDKLHADGLLGPDVQLVHVVHTTPGEREIIASTGTHVSTSPPVEAMAGMGMPPLGDLLDAGILVSLSTDVTATNNAADMFSLMRTTRALERYRAHGAEELPGAGPGQRAACAWHHAQEACRDGDHRRRTRTRLWRRVRIADTGQARRPDHGSHRRTQYERGRGNRSLHAAGQFGPAVKCGHGGERRAHLQARR